MMQKRAYLLSLLFYNLVKYHILQMYTSGRLAAFFHFASISVCTFQALQQWEHGRPLTYQLHWFIIMSCSEEFQGISFFL